MGTKKFRHLDLFSGIGGFALAASWVWKEQHEIVSFVEIEPFAQKVLNKHWPGTPIHGDIKTYEHNGTTIDLISGGFPCQPYSLAGKRRGSEDDRALWPEMLRIIKEAKPRWVIGENVTGFISMDLDRCLSDLESEGYETTAFIIPACGVSARHKRDRIWIVANSDQKGLQEFQLPEKGCKRPGPDRVSMSYCQHKWNPAKAFICRGAHGIPSRVDRIKGLGNAIVPQVVAVILAYIKQIEEMNYETV